MTEVRFSRDHFQVIKGDYMNKKRILIASIILIAMAIVLPLFNIPLGIGNPNLGSTPATLAAVYLPWPVGIIAALIKGIAAAIFTGKYWVEIPAGIGDALMALFTYWLAKRWHRAWAAAAGQISRVIFTSGMVALCISAAVAVNILSPSSAISASLTPSFFTNFGIIWQSITFPAIVLSALVNMVVSLIVIWLFSGKIERFCGIQR
jgi:hypothetical protein